MDFAILGARGGLGSLVAAQLGARGYKVRAIPRAGACDPEVIARAAEGAEAIINCAGASVALGFGRGWRGYGAVDVPIGLAAVAAARATKTRLVYVGVHHAPALATTPYVAAHERVASAMRDVPGATIVRATGFFSAFAMLEALARRGVLVDVGAGTARTNPIDEHELAEIVAEIAIDRAAPAALSAGGPQIMTRRQIFEIVRERAAVERGGRVRLFGMPVWLSRAGAAMLRLVHPRMGQFAAFACGLARHDCVAPQLGTSRLADYLAGGRVTKSGWHSGSAASAI